jgi:uncharacterized protein (DUF1501 family)
MSIELSAWSRRRVLRAAGLLAAGAALPKLLFAGTGGSPRLVVVILRGALDGLAAVPAYGDPHYAALHRDLAIGAPGTADGALALDGTFGLHPSLGFLHEQYLAGQLIVFQAVASPYRDRSHFDGQNVLENGLLKPIGTADGWLNRALAALPARHGADERAVALSQNVPLILRGQIPVVSKSPSPTATVDEELLTRLADLYSKDDWFAARLSEALQTDKLTGDMLETTPQTMATPMAPSHDMTPSQDMTTSTAAPAPTMAAANTPAAATSPRSAPDRLTAVARIATALMTSEGGPEIAVMEATGWDTHANQGAAKGTLAQRLLGLDKALRALSDGLQGLWPQTAVLVVTEFGRTAAMNGTRGTDHGTGGCAFLLGGAVRGGRVVADWPGLSPGALLDNRDVRPTLDLRSVFKGVLDEHLHIDAKTLSGRVFPDSAGARTLQGLVRA